MCFAPRRAAVARTGTRRLGLRCCGTATCDLPLAGDLGLVRPRQTHIAEGAASADELAQVGGEVVAAVVIFYARRPVGLAGAHEDVLGVVGDEAVDVGLVVDFEALGHRRGGGACACWRRAAGDDGEGWWFC